jgi:transcriptional regulator GlxA family with amidase domain
VTCKVGIFVFNDVEVLDFAGPYEVFTTASRLHGRSAPSTPEPFAVFTVGKTSAPVRARAGLSVYPDYAFDDHPTIDLLLIPGGVVTAELDTAEVVQWIRRTTERASLTASVCTGAFLLAKAGLLEGKSATTHWEDIDDLRTMFPSVQVQERRRWVDEGSVVTSAGISAGIDMSLHLVERMTSRKLAERTARQMEFDWTQTA